MTAGFLSPRVLNQSIINIKEHNMFFETFSNDPGKHESQALHKRE